MALGCGMSIIKYVLFIFNLLCALSGIAILTIGIISIVKVNDLQNAMDYNIPAIPITITVFGIVVLIISFFGCCGSIKESHCMIMTYAGFLLFLVIGQIVIGSYVLANYSDVSAEITKQFDNMWNQRLNSQNHQDAVNIYQTVLQCCGSSGPNDYGLLQLPTSCCPIVATPTTCAMDRAHTQGCRLAVAEFVDDGALLIGIVLLCLAGVELIGFIFACCLANSIRNQDRRQYA